LIGFERILFAWWAAQYLVSLTFFCARHDFAPGTILRPARFCAPHAVGANAGLVVEFVLKGFAESACPPAKSGLS
jgi:hypothetical protein